MNPFFPRYMSKLELQISQQVMANTTLTKLELEDHEGEFFVNVGNLEVEETFADNYDPLQDKQEPKKKVTKKRKKSTASADGSKASPKKKAAKKTKEDALDKSSKSEKSTKSKKSTTSAPI